MLPAPTFGIGLGRVIMEPGWETKISNELRHEFKEIGEEIVAVARALVPVRTGALKRSIRSRVEQPRGHIHVEVMAEAPYAAFVEYGTGRRGQMTQNLAAGAGSGQLRSLGRPSFSYGAFPGMVAQPYLRPAMVSVLARRFGWGS